LQVCRYVERNALRAGLVQRAEAWRWSSLGRRRLGPQPGPGLLSAWPLPVPADWLREVNRPQTEAELEALRRCVQRGQPYGDEAWQPGAWQVRMNADRHFQVSYQGRLRIAT
jgi:putative transposase